MIDVCRAVHKLTDINVVFSQSHQGEEEDVPVQTPAEERVQSCSDTTS